MRHSPALLPLPLPPQNHASQTGGFTMVELLIVLAIGLSLLGLSAPFVSAARSEIAMQQTLRQIQVDMKAYLGHALSGKSLAALSSDDSDSLFNPQLLPAYYGLYLETSAEAGDPAPYAYVELRTEIGPGGIKFGRSIYTLAKAWPAPAVFLKTIRFKDSSGQAALSPNKAWIFFEPPFGKVRFTPASSSPLQEADFELNEQNLLSQSEGIDQIELEFWHQDDSSSATVLGFGRDKMFRFE